MTVPIYMTPTSKEFLDKMWQNPRPKKSFSIFDEKRQGLLVQRWVISHLIRDMWRHLIYWSDLDLASLQTTQAYLCPVQHLIIGLFRFWSLSSQIRQLKTFFLQLEINFTMLTVWFEKPLRRHNDFTHCCLSGQSCMIA